MPALFTIQALDETLANLDFKQGTLKIELTRVIRSYFTDDQSLQTISSIPTDEIIFKIWGPCQADELKTKKKNFSSLKSALNKSLKDLDKAGGNQAGIILGRDNIFIVSEKRKDDLINQMGLAPNSPSLLRDMFAAFKQFFSENIKDQNINKIKDLLAEFEEVQKELREIVGLNSETGQGQSVAETAGSGVTTSGTGEWAAQNAPVGTLDFLQGGEIKTEGEIAGEATPQAQGLGTKEGGLKEEESTEEVEIIDEEVEILESDEMEEVLEDETLQAGGRGEEEGGLAEEESTEEVEIIDEEVEILESDEMGEVLEDETPQAGGRGEEESGLAEEESTEEVEVFDEEVEILESPEIEEVLEDETAQAGGRGEEEGGLAEEESTEEVEVIDEEVEILESPETEEVFEDETARAGGLSDKEGGLPEEENTEEVEIIDENDLEKIEESAEPITKNPHQPNPLEVLSKYIEAEEALNQGDLLRETQEEFVNQILDRFMPKFIKIPADNYIVGSVSPKDLEQPLRKIRLHDFYLGQSPVTNDLFDMFVRETGYTTDAEEAGYGIVFEGRCTNRIDPETGRGIFSLTRGTLARHVSGATWRHPSGPGSSLEGKHNHPVVQVSHHDAMAFAAWAGKRLPTEEEWEAAARGASGQLFPWGDKWQADLGNFESACLGETTSVDHYGRKAISPFGIHDLLGNTAEWTSSPHIGQTGQEADRTKEKIQILKGGSWITGGVVTVAWRQIERVKYWANTIGFRCAV